MTIHKVKAPKIPTQLLEDSHHLIRERIALSPRTMWRSTLTSSARGYAPP
jgi:hypothetical protein